MEIRISKTTTPKLKAPETDLGFGRFFTDHLFAMDFTADRGWYEPRIQPYAPFQIDPAAGVFHYGQAMFEGSKAFRGDDGVLRLFRPMAHAERMRDGAPRLCMPTPTAEQMVEACKALVRVDAEWVPKSAGTSLYLRPTLIATEGFLGVRPANEYRFFIIASPVGSYYGGTGLKPVRIWVETVDVRAPRGGLGAAKAGANYAASLHAAVKAKKAGYDQVLWLDGKNHELVEEVGTMNLFALIGNTLITPSLSDSILAGITRDSVITLARGMGLMVEERALSVKELRVAQAKGELREVFGTGTAAVVSPVGELAFSGETMRINDGKPGAIGLKLFETITGIQRGVVEDSHGWMQTV
jgi:branched-chain amino acid aminotransferase